MKDREANSDVRNPDSRTEAPERQIDACEADILHREIDERKRTEKELRQSLRYFSDIIQFYPDATVVIDREGRVIAWNRAMEDLTGVKAGEILGKGDYEYALPFYNERRPILIDLVIHPDPELRKKYLLAEVHGDTLVGEAYIRNMRGEEIYFHGTAAPIRDSGGRIVGAIESVRDITTRKKIEEDLERKNVVLSTQQEASIDGILVVDEHNAIISFNRRFVEMWGIPPEMAEAGDDAPVLQFVTAKTADPENFLARVRYLYAHDEEKSRDEIALRDGRVFDRYSAPMMSNGNCYGRVWYFRDITERKMAEEAVREKEERLRTITDTARDAIIMMDDNGKITFWNPAAEEVFGYTAAEAVGEELHAILAPRDYYESYRKGFEGFRETGEGAAVGKTLELVAVRKDGAEFPVELSLSAINIRGTWHAVGIIRDITRRRQAEEFLADEERFVSKVLDSIQEHICIIDVSDFRIVRANASLLTDLQLSEEEVIGNKCYEITHRLDHPCTSPDDACPVGRVVETGDRAIAEHIHYDKDGEKVYVEISVYPIHGKDGRVERVVHISRNITQRKKIEGKLRKFSLAVEQSPVTIVITDTSGTIQYVNPAFTRATQYTGDEAIGQNPRVLKSGLTPPEVYADLWRTITSGKEWRGEWCDRKKNGELFWESAKISPITDADGTITNFMAIKEDITERKRIEEDIRRLNQDLELKVEERTRQLMEAQEELVRREKLSILGQLSGSVGHELRNPLGVMNNAVYFLKMTHADADETTKEYLDIIKNEIDGSLRIISDLLDFARTRKPQARMVTVRQLFDESLGKCVIPENVELEVDLPDAVPPVSVDPLQIGQVLQNLVTNAVQAMPEGGVVRLASRRVPSDVGVAPCGCPEPGDHAGSPLRDFVEIAIANTGEGIAPENMKNLFQPLFTTKAKGIGLGLVVCKNLVEANGGVIEVQSRPGEGTTFAVKFPVQ